MTQGNGGATPLVTVVTPAYNVARYIGEAVDSVLRQSFRDFEYLVVDDGSSDSTVQEWAKVARSAGFARLARSLAGWQLLAWHAMPGGGLCAGQRTWPAPRSSELSPVFTSRDSGRSSADVQKPAL